MLSREQESFIVKKVYGNWVLLKSIDFENQTSDICASACSSNGDAVMYCAPWLIDIDLIRICVETSHRPSLETFRRLSELNFELTFDIIKMSCHVDGRHIRYVPNELCSRELLEIACTSTWKALTFIDDELKLAHPDICLLSFNQDSRAINGYPIDFVTIELVESCIDGSKSKVSFFCREIMLKMRKEHKVRFEAVLGRLMSLDGSNLGHLSFRWQTRALVEKAVRNNGLMLSAVSSDLIDMDLMKIAVRSDGNAIEFCKDQTEELCMIAFESDWRCFSKILSKNRPLKMAQYILSIGGVGARVFLEGLGYTVKIDTVVSGPLNV